MISTFPRGLQANARLLAAVLRTSRNPSQSTKRHGLPAELVVSLTSYPPRFPTLVRTLRSLLSQSIRPDRVVLWIAHQDLAALPQDVLSLIPFGLDIRGCDDLRSYTKIIHSLEAWPDAYIVTAADDLYYEPQWLNTLVSGVTPGEKVIVCRRAHRPDLSKPYRDWRFDVITDGTIEDDLFPTGVGGVLYPPNSLHPDTVDRRFMNLCPTADDVWLYWMGRKAGCKYRQVGGGFAQIAWRETQAVTLGSINLEHGNDVQLQAVAASEGSH